MTFDYDILDFSIDFLKLGYKRDDNQSIDLSSITSKIDKYLIKIEKYKKYIDDYEKISNDLFIYFLETLGSLKLSIEDYLNILEKANNKKYKSMEIIKTTMLTKTKMPYRVTYLAALSDNIKYSPNYIYSTSELDSLIKSNDIVLFTELKEHIDEFDYYEVKKYYVSHDKDDFLKPSGEYFKSTLEYIKEIFNSEKLKELMDEHIKILESEIKYAVKFGNSNSNYSEVSQTLKEEVDRSYMKRIKELKGYES